MKNTNKKISADPIAEARKDKKFLAYSEEAAARIRLGIEIYQARLAHNLSQQALAAATKTTQKMISNLESGNVDIRNSTLIKIKTVLGFGAENWARIYNFKLPVKNNLIHA
jgi:predicted transcriptional regulator